MNTRDTIERHINGALIEIYAGEEDEPSKRPETLDVHISVIYEGGGADVDPTKIFIIAEGADSELRGSLVRPLTSQVGPGWQKQAGHIWQTIVLTIRFPAPAGWYETPILKFDSGALRFMGETQDVQPIRFRRVTKRDVYYVSINC